MSYITIQGRITACDTTYEEQSRVVTWAVKLDTGAEVVVKQIVPEGGEWRHGFARPPDIYTKADLDQEAAHDAQLAYKINESGWEPPEGLTFARELLGHGVTKQ